MKSYTVLITGASRGIGRAIASACIKKGFSTILLCKGDCSRMEDLVLLAKEQGSLCYTYSVDVANPAQINTFFDDLASKQIHIDVLINNAGISYVGLLQDMSIDDWHTSVNTNLSSVFYMSRKVIPDMVASHRGKIINISSVWGQCGASCEVAYSATKGGMNAFTKALAKELAPSNIQVNALACGAVVTEMNGHLSEEELQQLAEEIPVGRLAEPAEIAEAVLQLMDAGPYVTGQVITVDGGWIS